MLKIHAKATAPGRVHVDKKGRKDEIHGGVTLALANNSWNRQLCLEKVELFVKIVLYEHTKKMTNNRAEVKRVMTGSKSSNSRFELP